MVFFFQTHPFYSLNILKIVRLFRQDFKDFYFLIFINLNFSVTNEYLNIMLTIFIFVY